MGGRGMLNVDEIEALLPSGCHVGALNNGFLGCRISIINRNDVKFHLNIKKEGKDFIIGSGTKPKSSHTKKISSEIALKIKQLLEKKNRLECLFTGLQFKTDITIIKNWNEYEKRGSLSNKELEALVSTIHLEALNAKQEEGNYKCFIDGSGEDLKKLLGVGVSLNIIYPYKPITDWYEFYFTVKNVAYSNYFCNKLTLLGYNVSLTTFEQIFP